MSSIVTIAKKRGNSLPLGQIIVYLTQNIIKSTQGRVLLIAIFSISAVALISLDSGNLFDI